MKKQHWIRSCAAALLLSLLLAGLSVGLTGCGQTADTGREKETESSISTEAGDGLPTGQEEAAEAAETDQADGGADALLTVREDALTLQYDDFYDFSLAYPGYVVAEIETVEVRSGVVKGGILTGGKDPLIASVVNGERTVVNARGVGEAVVLLTESERLADVQAVRKGEYKKEEAVPVLQVRLSVEPAVLTMMFLSGQSNMSGLCSEYTGFHPEDSVLCERGTAYSTYRDTGSEKTMRLVTGVEFEGCLKPEQLVPGAINSSANALNGDMLHYRLDALSAEDGGKTGIDAALAYEWNRLSGEKVWVINCARDGSKAATWQPGEKNYEAAAAILQECLRVYTAELEAGHFTEGRRLMFWQQGESDWNEQYSDYLHWLETTFGSFDNLIGLDRIGIISTRYTSTALSMLTPRLVQYAMACSTGYGGKVYMVSNENEQWVTDGQITEYFAAAYPAGFLDYPLRADTGIGALPTTVSEVHADVHYSQVGHNENGLLSARAMYAVVTGDTEPKGKITWVTNRSATGLELDKSCEVDGMKVPCAVREVNVGPIFLYALPENICATKNVRLDFDHEAMERTADGSGFTLQKTGTYYVVARDRFGLPISAVKLVVYP